MRSLEEAAFWDKTYKPTADSDESEDDIATPLANPLQDHYHALRNRHNSRKQASTDDTYQAARRAQKAQQKAFTASKKPAPKPYYVPSNQSYGITRSTPEATADQTARRLFRSAPTVSAATKNLALNQSISDPPPSLHNIRVCRNSALCREARVAASDKEGIFICLCYGEKSACSSHDPIDQSVKSSEKAGAKRLVRDAKPTPVQHVCHLLKLSASLACLIFSLILIRWYYDSASQVDSPAAPKQQPQA